MPKKKFTAEQIAFALRQAEAGTPVGEICRKMGVAEARRRYGYYVFPVMQGDRVIGRLDARRRGGAIHVRAFWPEAGERMGKARQAGLESELARVNSFVGMEAVEFAEDWIRA